MGRKTRTISGPVSVLASPRAFEWSIPPLPADETEPGRRPRREAVAGTAAMLIAVFTLGAARPSGALVRGNAPPKDGYKNYSKKANCANKEDCQEIGREREKEEFGTTEDVKYEKTSSGARFKDVTKGSPEAGVAVSGSVVRLRYRVMRSGKRASDGLSGEASTIFSLGYGEDDGPKNAVLTSTLGEGQLIKALDEGLVGMAVGGTRRVQVRPENGLGWKKPGKCAEEDFTMGIVAGIPGGKTENEETCLNTKLPQPTDFGSKRRFSRRFDESLIVEAELVGLGAS